MNTVAVDSILMNGICWIRRYSHTSRLGSFSLTNQRTIMTKKWLLLDFDRMRIIAQSSKAWTAFAVAHLLVIAALAIFAGDGYSFRPSFVDSLAGIGIILFALPTLFVLYINRSRTWAGIVAACYVVIIMFPGLPGGPLARFPLCLAAAIIFARSDLKLWQELVFGLPVLLIVFFFIILLALYFLAALVTLRAPFEISTSTSPDLKHEVEAMGFNQGPLGAETRARLYKIHRVSIIRRFEREIGSDPNWPSKVKIRWIDNKTFEIEGKRFDLGAAK